MNAMNVTTFRESLKERDLCESRAFNLKDLRLDGDQYIWDQDDSEYLVDLSTTAERQLCYQLSIPHAFYSGHCNQYLKEKIFNTTIKDLYKPNWSAFTQVFAEPSVDQKKTVSFKSFSMPFTYVKSADLFDAAVDLFARDQSFTVDDIVIKDSVLDSDTTRYTLLSPEQEAVAAGDFTQAGLEITFPDRVNKSLDLGSYLYRLVCMNGAIAPFASKLRRQLKGDKSISTTHFLNNFRRLFSLVIANIFESLHSLSTLREITFTGDISKVIKTAMKEYRVPEKYFDYLLDAYNKEPEANQYGLLNAFSRAANDGKLTAEESRRLQIVAGRGMFNQEDRRCDKCFHSLV